MKKTIILGVVIGAVLLFAFIFFLPDGKLHLVFCDVGQGDAAYIRTPGGQDILIDGGPNERVLGCLGKYMPFYDRTIDVVLLSHPQKDHFQGLQSVIERYTVKYFVSSPIAGEGENYQKLAGLLKQKKIPVRYLYAGDKFSLGETGFDVLWPEKEWAAVNSDLSVLGLATPKRDPNEFSYFLHLHYGEFDVLFTGDGDGHIQPEIEKTVLLPDVEVLKIPHHGSKTGLLPDFLEIVKPELAVISVGKNSYGHPAEEILKLLKGNNVVVKRTDRDGNTEIISDGRGWEMR